MIALTFDTDWAVGPILAYTNAILKESRARATVFCTDSKPKDEFSEKWHELAIHPFFTEKDGEYSKLHNLLQMYPQAKGIRAHCSYVSTKVNELCAQLGLLYDSSYIIPRPLDPFPLFGLTEIPVRWADNYVFTYNRALFSREEIAKIALEDRLSVFLFHPIHVYLNTDTYARYEQAKPHYHDPKMLEKFRNRSAFGTEDCLRYLLELISKKSIPMCQMREAAAHPIPS